MMLMMMMIKRLRLLPCCVHRSLHVPVRRMCHSFKPVQLSTLNVKSLTRFSSLLSRSTKSVITKPQNVYVMRDIMCSGYVAGGNTRFFGVEGKKQDFSEPANPEYVKSSMEARLSFQDDSAAEYASMLAFCAPYNDGVKRDQVISISSRLLPWEVTTSNGKEYFPGNKKNFDAVKDVLGLDSIHFGEDMRAAENMEFISQVSIAPLKTLSFTHQQTRCLLACVRLVLCAGFHEQLSLLRRPASQVQPLQQPVPRTCAGPSKPTFEHVLFPLPLLSRVSHNC